MSSVMRTTPRRRPKPGRNDLCPCGSGLKYKKCCLQGRCGESSLPPSVQTKIGAHLAAEQRRREQFGEVRPIIHADHQGRKFVAVGSRVIFDQPEKKNKWNTFTDVLLDYVRLPLGSGWGQNELKKPLAGRHPIMQWFAHFCDLQQKTATRDADGMYSMTADGISSAFLHLAYDLYILDDHQKLQKEALRRLRLRENFAGARYELLARIIHEGADFG